MVLREGDIEFGDEEFHDFVKDVNHVVAEVMKLSLYSLMG